MIEAGALNLFPTRILKNMGCMLNAIRIDNEIPIMVTIEIENNAGWFAKTRTPIPKNVVINDIMIELLCINIDLSENLFSLINPFVIKML